MGKNEQTTPKSAKLASKILSGEIPRPTPKQAKSLAGALLNQAPDKKKGK